MHPPPTWCLPPSACLPPPSLVWSQSCSSSPAAVRSPLCSPTPSPHIMQRTPHSPHPYSIWSPLCFPHCIVQSVPYTPLLHEPPWLTLDPSHAGAIAVSLILKWYVRLKMRLFSPMLNQQGRDSSWIQIHAMLRNWGYLLCTGNVVAFTVCSTFDSL